MPWAVAERLKVLLLSAGVCPPFLTYGALSSQGVFRFVISSEHSRRRLSEVVSVLSESGPLTG